MLKDCRFKIHEYTSFIFEWVLTYDLIVREVYIVTDLERAIRFREQGQLEESRNLLLDLSKKRPA